MASCEPAFHEGRVTSSIGSVEPGVLLEGLRNPCRMCQSLRQIAHRAPALASLSRLRCPCSHNRPIANRRSRVKRELQLQGPRSGLPAAAAVAATLQGSSRCSRVSPQSTADAQMHRIIKSCSFVHPSQDSMPKSCLTRDCDRWHSTPSHKHS